MIRRNSRFLLLGFTTLLALVPVAAGASSITVYEHDRFRGRSQTFEGEVPDLRALGWNDRISSVRVESGDWEVCKDTRFRGCELLPARRGTIPNLGDRGWNDRISSLRPLRGDDVPVAVVVAKLTREEAKEAAERLYQALLGRPADPRGGEATADELYRGRREEVVQRLVASDEYRRNSRRKSADDLLDQIFRGLLDRAPGAWGPQSFSHYLEDGHPEVVVLRIMNSEEFLSKLKGTFVTRRNALRGVGVLARGDQPDPWFDDAVLVLEKDGRFELTLQGDLDVALSGTWSRSGDTVRLGVQGGFGGYGARGEGTAYLVEQEVQRIELAGDSSAVGGRFTVSFVASAARR